MDKGDQYRYCMNCEYCEGINKEAMDVIVCRLAGVPQMIVQHGSNCVGFKPRRRVMDKNKKPCFYDNIYIHPDHLGEWAKEFDTKDKAMDSLIEEMAELTQAICKLKRVKLSGDVKQDRAARDNMREEAAHVLVSLAGLALYYDCTLRPEEVQKKIQSKWPEAYRTGDELFKLKVDMYEKIGKLKEEEKKKEKLKEMLNKAYGICSAESEIRTENEKLKSENSELKKNRDYWKDRCNSVMTDISNTLSVFGIEFTFKDVLGDVNWKIGIDIPELNEAKDKIKRLEDDNSVKAEALIAAKDRGDYWKRKYDDLAEYWDNTYNGMVAAGKKVGVKIEFKGDASDSNEGNIDITNEKTDELEKELENSKHLSMLKSKRLNEKNQKISDLKKELEELKSKTVAEARYELGTDCYTIVYTMCDGSKQTTGIDFARDIDASSISCGTIPTCKSCKNYRYFANTGAGYGHCISEDTPFIVVADCYKDCPYFEKK